MSRPMSMTELGELLKHVACMHRPGSGAGKWIKYVHPVIDNRTGTCHYIMFRDYGSDHVLHCQNENRGLKESLYERCLRFLEQKE